MLKALSWRAAGTLTSAVIAFVFTRRVDVAVAIGGFDLVSKIALFFLHERLWSAVRFGTYEIEPRVVWLTGLSGSGKTTLARRVEEYLRSRHVKVEVLDGDAIRAILPQTGFTREARDEHIRRTGLLASYLQRNGVWVVCALISPYEESRAFVRSVCGSFVEVYLSAPLEACEARDAKGLYAKARRGELKSFTGIDDPYEPPKAAELTLDTSKLSVDEAAAQIEAYLASALR
jgi:adenylylsulfate kinase